MEFRHESGTTPVTRPVSQSGAANLGVAATQHKSGRGKRFETWTWAKAGFTCLLFASTLLVVAIAGLIAFSSNGQSAYINNAKFQAVFINDGSSNGQSVYFGHITKLTSDYLILDDVYYITTPGSTTSSTNAASSNYSLTQLGCQQLHDPYDQMVINTSQVAFWENLQNGGKVVSAITTYQKDNPKGPNCSVSTGTVGTTTNTQSTAPTTTK